jgi:hypothetical protein
LEEPLTSPKTTKLLSRLSKLKKGQPQQVLRTIHGMYCDVKALCPVLGDNDGDGDGDGSKRGKSTDEQKNQRISAALVLRHYLVKRLAELRAQGMGCC